MDKGIQAARLADQIRDYLATWSRTDLSGYLFSIVSVTITPDHQKAMIWVDSLNPEKTAHILRELNHNRSKYQRDLYRHIGKRNCPGLTFYEAQQTSF